MVESLLTATFVLVMSGIILGVVSWFDSRATNEMADDIFMELVSVGIDLNILGKFIIKPILFYISVVVWIAFWIASLRFIPDLLVKGRFDHWRRT